MNSFQTLMRDMVRPEAPQPQWLRKAIAMQEIEGNPLTPEEIAMFENFEARGLSHEQRRAEMDELLLNKYGIKKAV